MAWQTPKTNWKAGDVPAATDFNRIEGNVEQNHDDLNTHKSDYVLQVPYGEATGSANSYAVTLDPAPTSYVDGMAIAVKINVQNTGASTININGLGAKSIKKPNGNNVSAGNLKAGSIYSMRYNGTNFILQGSDSAGDATPADVLSGKTFSSDVDTELVGTMPNRGGVTIIPSTSDIAIPAGYHNGAGKVEGDTNLKAENIKEGISIFGINGIFPIINERVVSAGNVITPLVDDFEQITGMWLTNFYFDFTVDTYWVYGCTRNSVYSGIVTSLPIDLTNFSKILIIYRISPSGTGSGEYEFNTNTTKIWTSTGAINLRQVTDYADNRLVPLLVDIDSLDGNHYLMFRHRGGDGATMRFYSIVLY